MTLEPQVIEAVLERLKPAIDAIIRDKVAVVARRLESLDRENARLAEENADLRDMLEAKIIEMNPLEDRGAAKLN
jgi:hypothetical protein